MKSGIAVSRILDRLTRFIGEMKKRTNLPHREARLTSFQGDVLYWIFWTLYHYTGYPHSAGFFTEEIPDQFNSCSCIIQCSIKRLKTPNPIKRCHHPLRLIPMKEKIIGSSSRQYIVCAQLSLSLLLLILLESRIYALSPLTQCLTIHGCC